MAISRYDNTPILDRRFFTTQQSYNNIKSAIDNHVIQTRSYITQPLDRLDILAKQFYEDGRYWWIIAIANDIGWAMQLNGGVLLRIPITLESVTSRL